MTDPSSNVPQHLVRISQIRRYVQLTWSNQLRHVHLVCNKQYPVMHRSNVNAILQYLLEATRITHLEMTRDMRRESSMTLWIHGWCTSIWASLWILRHSDISIRLEENSLHAITEYDQIHLGFCLRYNSLISIDRVEELFMHAMWSGKHQHFSKHRDDYSVCAKC